jgi:hypothetical protein
MALQPAEWQRYEPVDDGTAVRIVANMGALELRRVDVEDGPDAVTITIYEDLPDGVGVIPAIGIGATLFVPLPSPLEGRPVIDGASGERRRDRIEPWKTGGVRVPVGEEFSWKELTGHPWWRS